MTVVEKEIPKVEPEPKPEADILDEADEGLSKWPYWNGDDDDTTDGLTLTGELPA